MEDQETTNQGEGATERMNAAEVAGLLSQTMKNLVDKKTTVRHAMAISRVALAMAKVIEVADLKDRVEFIERVIMKKRKSK